MKVVFVVFLLFFCGSTMAHNLTVEYSSFYSHLRKIDSDDTPALQFAFGFKQVGKSTLCQINSARIVTQKVELPIEITTENRFLLPTEKALKQARAVVEIDLSQPSNKCDMSVQLETKPEYLKLQYTAAEIQVVFEQYQTFFDDMGSFLSFLMPDVEGLHFHFNDKLDGQNSTGIVIKDNHAYINEQWIAQGNSLSFEQVPVRITAVTED